jgi:hypothetical protein
MATLTKGKTFVNGELVTPANLHQMVDAATVANIVNADIAAAAAIADTKLAQITTAGKVANSATTATNASTANAIVARDGSGNFSAGTITANLTGNVTGNASTATTATTAAACSGNAATATTLQTARTINGVSFNGSANITVTAAPDSHTHGNITNLGAIGTTAGLPIITGTSGVLQAGSFGSAVGSFCQGSDSRLSDSRTPTDGSVTDAKVSATAAIADTKLATISTSGKVSNSATTATNANTANAIVARDGSGNFSAGTITASLSGNATTATTLQTTRTINGVEFNGGANITITADPNSHTHDDRYYTETEVNTLLTDKQKINGKISSGLNWNTNQGILFNIPENVQRICLVVEDWSHNTAGQGIVLVGTTTAGILNAQGPIIVYPYFNNVNNVESFQGFAITGRANTTANHAGVFDFFIGKNPDYYLNNNLPVNRLFCRSNLQQYTGGTFTSTLLNGAGFVDIPGVLNQILLRPFYGSTNPGSRVSATLYYYY